MQGICAVVLAAGKGTRMNQDLPKVLSKVAGKPILSWSLELLNKLSLKTVVVCSDERVETFSAKLGATTVNQKELLGTAKTLQAGLQALPRDCKTVLVLYGDDSFLYKPETIKNFVKTHKGEGNDLTLLLVLMDKPQEIGALRRDKQGKPMGFQTKEEMEEKGILQNEVVCGAFCFEKEWLEENLKKVTPLASGEYLLTSLIPLGYEDNAKIESFVMQDKREWWGVNRSEDLEVAEKYKRELLSNE